MRSPTPLWDVRFFTFINLPILEKQSQRNLHQIINLPAANMTSKVHLHNPTGITDEAAIEGHDLIHNAEVEEQKVGAHPHRDSIPGTH